MHGNLDYITRLQAVECHDSTYMPKQNPLVFAKAEGSKIWDTEGREFIDLCAGFGALALGHASRPLREVAGRYLDKIPPIEHGMGDVYPSEEKILFLETIQSMMPKAYGKGALALGGGQAVEIALKTAMLSTKRSGFIVFEDGYHGLDLGVLPLTARQDFRTPFKDWLAEERVIRLPYGCPMDQLDEAVLRLKSFGLAAILAEPLQGRAGVKHPPEGWLSMLADVAHRAGGLLIFDEIFTGFGRLGFVTAAEKVDADILCFGKAIGGGFPVSACFAREEIMDAWPQSSGEAIHTGTFFGHPFSLAVGRRTLQEITKLKLCDRATHVGRNAQTWLKSNIGSSPRVKEIRGIGLMIGIEFHVPGFAAELMDKLRSKQVIALPSGTQGQVLTISPALNIPEELLFEAMARLAECL
jgi:4-aminobutyrate aminotransferase-like enzyme